MHVLTAMKTFNRSLAFVTAGPLYQWGSLEATRRSHVNCVRWLSTKYFLSPAPSRRARWRCVSALDVAETKPIDFDSQDVDQNILLSKNGKQSKIVCTIGPKTCNVESIEELAALGMDVVRLNMSHGTHEWHKEVIRNTRIVREKGMHKLSILLDTKGPEVRSGDLKAPLKIERGQRFVWTIRNDFQGEPNTVDVSYDDFVKDIHVGDLLLVDGGMSSFVCTEITETDVITECVDGGVLTSRRHLNVRGKSASLPAITDKDWEDIKFGIENDVDFYALSFVKHQDDVLKLKNYLHDQGVKALVLSKIESADAVKQLRPILEASDGAMVARGDLGAEIPIEDVPLVQEEIVAINRALRKPTIVATHMLESMITYPAPTRAEVTDITEAIRQGADATMLSGETANGSYPREAVEVMATVASSVVKQNAQLSDSPLFSPSARPPQNGRSPDPRLDLAYAASTIAYKVRAKAIVVFTRTGTYGRLVSSTRPRCPIIAFAPDQGLVQRLTLLWGVQPFSIDFENDPEETTAKAIEFLKRQNLTSSKDTLVLTSDMLTKGNGKVNTIQIRRVH